MTKRYTVIAAIAGKESTTFYTKSGQTVVVNANDPRLPKLLAQCQPFFARKQPVDIDLEDYSMYGEFEEKTNGLVRFFRTAKAKVKSIVESLIGDNDDTTAEEDTVTYQIKQQSAASMIGNPAVNTTEQPTESEVAQVTATALEEALVAPMEPVASKQKPRYEDLKSDFRPTDEHTPLQDDETMVAVINGVAIPGIEKLKPYLVHALRHNSEKAVIAFLERIARVIDNRGHSIPDLLNFLEKGDLPLAEDGSIIAYKILRKTTSHPGFTYVDCHSGNVHQRVGTFVRVEEKLVDKNRSNECSNGLHVARRGYIGHFSGDVCTMIKMAPEDVIAVPHGDYNKVRCCGYHVIFELPKHVYDVLRSNKSMTSDPEAAAMLEKAIKGDHVGVLEEVWIGGSRGSNLSVKNRVEGAIERVEQKKTKVAMGTEVSSNAASLDDPAKNTLDVKELQKTVKAEEAKAAAEANETNLEAYNRILSTKDTNGAQALLDRKKKAKKSWEKLGYPLNAGTKLQDVVSGFAAAVSDPSPVVEAKAEPVDESGKSAGFAENISRPVIGEDLPKVPEPKEELPANVNKPVKGKKTKLVKPSPKPVPEAVVKAATRPAEPKKTLTVAEQAMELYCDNKFTELKAFAKSKKKSLSALGFSEDEIAKINA